MMLPNEQYLQRKSTRLRHGNSLWLCNLLILSASQSSCQAFVAPQRSLTDNQRHTSSGYIFLKQSPVSSTDTEIKETIEHIAIHPEQKRQVVSDMISGSINITKIDFNHPRPHSPVTHHHDSQLQPNKDTIDISENPRALNLPTLRSMWKKRNARTAEEGIRRQKTGQLSDILARANDMDYAKGRRYGARTIMGLIHALAEEVVDLDVEIDARRDSPLWDKQVDAIRIKFSRLGFKPLRMGGLDQAFHEYKMKFPDTQQGAFYMDRQLYDVSCADEAFERIDIDNSGALDSDEIAEALVMAARSSDETEHKKLKTILKGLASELVALYDFNGDGVVDRSEYQTMVEDMAALNEKQELELTESDIREDTTEKSSGGWLASIRSFVQGLFSWTAASDDKESGEDLKAEQITQTEILNGNLDTTQTNPHMTSSVRVDGDSAAAANGLVVERSVHTTPDGFDWANAYTTKNTRISEVTDEQLASLVSSGKDLGSITISDLKVDLRRLVFGAIPLIKHIIPGGPLILEPFTMTLTASFNSYDIKNSLLLDAGLRRLVAQAIRRRVRSLRDIIDGAVFYGRSWKMSSTTAPIVDVIAIEDVEFDTANRLILTGRVRVRTAPEQPIVENAFKLRAKLGTNAAGRRIRLVEPELALVLECPKSWESISRQWCDFLNISERRRPKPLYFFFPIYSPFKLEDPENDGFDLGEDNKVKSIYIKDNALRFEMSAVLRPGRFLGNHYLAFTIPNRTFIITLDRVKEGMRAARKAKQAAKAVQEATVRTKHKLPVVHDLQDERNHAQLNRVQPKSFFSRFVDGYIQAERDDANSERVTRAIRDFFGRQSARRNRRVTFSYADKSSEKTEKSRLEGENSTSDESL